MTRFNVKHIACGHPVASEPARIGVVCNLHDMPADVRRILRQKALNIIPINRQTSIVPELAAERCDASQAAKAHPLGGRGIVNAFPFRPKPVANRQGPCTLGYHEYEMLPSLNSWDKCGFH